jgi:hypothetical protein
MAEARFNQRFKTGSRIREYFNVFLANRSAGMPHIGHFYNENSSKCTVFVYMSNTTMFIGSMLSIYYIKHNYMFRPLMLAIIRLYTNTYQLVIQTYMGCLGGRERDV